MLFTDVYNMYFYIGGTMRRYFSYFTLFIVVALLSCHAGNTEQMKPEKVLRIVYEQKPNEWYVQQEALWKQEVDKDPKNPENWYNYYNAVRYARFEETIETKSKKEKLSRIIEEMGKAVPNTYDYYLLKFWNSYNLKDISLIEKAYNLDPERPDAYYPFISYYESNGDEGKMKEFCTKLYESEDIAPGLLNYNYNVLMSTKNNAVLFTNGDNDTYPVWVLQKARNIRNDVTVLNISISKEGKDYLQKKFKKSGITIDYSKLPAPDDENYAATLCKLISESNPSIPVYFALTVYSNFTNTLKDDLYLVGMAYRYSPERIDNLAILRKNFEENLHLDYLQEDWYASKFPATSLMPHFNMNYVAPMLMLAVHFQTAGETQKAERYKNNALDIAKKAGKEKEIEKYIAEKGL